MSEWHNIRLSELSAEAKQALENKLAASKLAAQANREFRAAITKQLGELPEGKEYAINLKLQWQQLGVCIVDAEDKPEVKAKAPKQSFAEWKAQQLANGHSV